MISGVTVQDVYSLAQQMIQNPADQVRLSSQLRELVASLPPPQNELVSRYQFDRAGLWTYAANFFDVTEAVDPPVEVIEVPHDSWIRGVVACALPALDETYVTAEDLGAAAVQRRVLSDALGTNFRGLFELRYRLNARQGFISTGTGEITPAAALVAGDAQYAAALDWRLQKHDTIEVRVRNRIGDLFADAVAPAISRTIPWIAVCFWAEELPQSR